MNEYKDQTEFYNRSSRYLDSLKEHKEEWFSDYVKFIMNNIPEGSKGIDIGCGMGLSVKLLGDLDYKIVGIDISELFLEEGSREYAIPREKLICGDALHLPFEDKSFDFVCSIDFVEHISDIKNLLKEMTRISKKYIVIFSPNYYDIFTWIKNLFATTFLNKSLFTFTEILKFPQLFNLTIKVIGLYPLKVFGIHKKAITVNPILSNEKIGGDYDLTWIINYFDIENILKKYGFIIAKSKVNLYYKTRSFIKIFAERR